MGIFKKILDWTSHSAPGDSDKNTETISSQPVEQDCSMRPVEHSCTVGDSTQNQAPHYFATSSDVLTERGDVLQSGGSDRLGSPDDEFLDQVVGAFDEAFDTACDSALPIPESSAGSVQNASDQATVQDLFAQIAAGHSKDLRNFVFELRCGRACKDRIQFLRSSLQMIGDAAAKMDLSQAVQRIAEFDEVLSIAEATSHRLLEDEINILIANSYSGLSEVLPDVFGTGEDQQRREDIIIRSLLQQLPGVGRVTFDKLYKAGLGSLHALFLANKEDLAAATSIPVALCERIVDRFQLYRSEAQGISQHDPQSGYRAHLAALVAELHRRHEELKSASAKVELDSGSATEKRRRRQLRQQCFLQILATLAELGEVDLIHRIQRLSFNQRLRRLGEYLETLDSEARSFPMDAEGFLGRR